LGAILTGVPYIHRCIRMDMNGDVNGATARATIGKSKASGKVRLRIKRPMSTVVAPADPREIIRTATQGSAVTC
jgi:hypothetical protein